MKRWSNNGEIENPKIDAFLEEVRALSERYGLAISHEDGHGGFEIVPIDQDTIAWLMQATDRTAPR
jgi:hypothetical protein